MHRSAPALVALGVVLAGRTAEGNGRFPSAQHVVIGPGAASSLVAVRTTFGFFVSRDGGIGFSWICEEGVGYGGGWDPPFVVTADGALLLGLQDGLARGEDDCAFGRVDSVRDGVDDLAVGPDGMRVVAAAWGAGGARVLTSVDGGGSFTARTLDSAVTRLTTLDVAPSRPTLVWAVGLRAAGAPVLLRADDDAMPFRVASEAVTEGATAWLSAVDPRDAETLWVRVPRGDRTELRRTMDGGRSWRTEFEIPGAMAGFAMSADGRRVWAGGPDAGLWRSEGGRFMRVLDAPVRCLGYHDGALYVCTDPLRDGVALARIRDGRDVPEPLLRYGDAEGAPDCPTRAPVFAACAPLWRAQRELVLRSQMDAATTTPRDASASAVDVTAAIDVGPDAAVIPQTPDGCGCGVGGRRARWSLWGVLLVARARRRRLAP